MSKLILTTGVPLMLSLLINSLYNFVDSVFVSRVAEDALTAISLSAPVQMFVSALGLGNASGVMLQIGESAVRIFALVWLISIPNLVISSALQGLSKANPSMLLTMLRQAVLPLAFAYVVSGMRQINFIWFAFVIAEIIMIYPAINIWRNNLFYLYLSYKSKIYTLITIPA